MTYGKLLLILVALGTLEGDGVENLARLCGISVRNLQRALGHLAALGVLDRHRTRHGTSYSVLMNADTEWAAALADIAEEILAGSIQGGEWRLALDQMSKAETREGEARTPRESAWSRVLQAEDRWLAK